jgi:hypothetical protein
MHLCRSAGNPNLAGGMESDAKPLAGDVIDAARILLREPAFGDTVIRHHVDTPNAPDGFQRPPNFLLYEVSAALVHPSPTTRQYVAPPQGRCRQNAEVPLLIPAALKRLVREDRLKAFVRGHWPLLAQRLQPRTPLELGYRAPHDGRDTLRPDHRCQIATQLPMLIDFIGALARNPPASPLGHCLTPYLQKFSKLGFRDS